MFSNRVGRMGQHKTQEQITQEEWEHYRDTKEELEEEDLLGLYYDSDF